MNDSAKPDRTDASRPRRWPLIISALLALSILLAQVYQRQLLELISGQAASTQVTPPPCDLNQQACPLPIMTPVMSEAPWSFAISPRPIPVSAPLTFSVTPPDRVLPGNQPSTVWVDLTGDTMDMGLIRIPLTLTADGRWEGTGSIPICVTGQMRWRARLHMQLEQTTLQADWLFTAPTSTSTHTSDR